MKTLITDDFTKKHQGLKKILKNAKDGDFAVIIQFKLRKAKEDFLGGLNYYYEYYLVSMSPDKLASFNKIEEADAYNYYFYPEDLTRDPNISDEEIEKIRQIQTDQIHKEFFDPENEAVINPSFRVLEQLKQLAFYKDLDIVRSVNVAAKIENFSAILRDTKNLLLDTALYFYQFLSPQKAT